MSATDNTREIAAKLGYMTEADLMALAGVTAGTAEAWRKRGKGPAPTRLGNTTLYRIDAVVQYLKDSEKQRTDSTARAAL